MEQLSLFGFAEEQKPVEKKQELPAVEPTVDSKEPEHIKVEKETNLPNVDYDEHVASFNDADQKQFIIEDIILNEPVELTVDSKEPEPIKVEEETNLPNIDYGDHVASFNDADQKQFIIEDIILNEPVEPTVDNNKEPERIKVEEETNLPDADYDEYVASFDDADQKQFIIEDIILNELYKEKEQQKQAAEITPAEVNFEDALILSSQPADTITDENTTEETGTILFEIINEETEGPKKKRGRKSFKEMDAEVDLVEVPDDEELFKKQYYSIGTVAKWFRVNGSLLRFWENEFDILKPRKNGKGDRLFRPEDVKNLQIIYYLLRQRKFSIDGAKKYMKSNMKKADTNQQVIQSLTKFKSFLLELKANLSL